MKIDDTIVERYIDPFIRGGFKEKDSLKHFMSISLGRVLQKHAGTPAHANVQDDNIKHIVDWLLSAIRNNEPWLTNVDKNGNPKKLLKFGTTEQILKEADKAMRISAQKSSRIDLKTGDEELFSVLDDGNYIVRLLTPKALDAETAAMQHCIGNGAYDDLLQREGRLLLSIRDKAGKPHVTLEVSEGEVIQVQGKQNKPPLKKYMDLVAKALQQNDFKLNANTAVLGYVIDSSFKVHLLDEIPEGTHFSGDQDWSYAMVTKLPDNLSFDGHFKAIYADFVEIPKGLRVRGDLNVYNSTVSTIPPCLHVGRHLDISYTRVQSIPDGVSVGGNIVASEASIMSLPESLNVNGSLVLCNCPISELPKLLAVSGTLDIMGTNIRELPKDLKIGGSLDIRSTPITRLPQDLEIPGILWLERTPLSSLPRGLKVGEIADLRRENRLLLEDNLTIMHDLNLARSAIARLPSGLKVGGNLMIQDTSITEIPEGTFVGKSVDIGGTQVKEIPVSIPDECIIDNGSKRLKASVFRKKQEMRQVLKNVLRMGF